VAVTDIRTKQRRTPEADSLLVHKEKRCCYSAPGLTLSSADADVSVQRGQTIGLVGALLKTAS
jgi:hypothetical protein